MCLMGIRKMMDGETIQLQCGGKKKIKWLEEKDETFRKIGEEKASRKG